MKNQIILLLGSNLGDRADHLCTARRAIANLVGDIQKTSSIYETAPWGVEQQADYLNQVVLVESEYAPHKVLEKVLAIEAKGGRVRQEKWGARAIDVDILFYNTLIIETENLIIPHPYMHLRRFALTPLVEILPDWVHPKLKVSVAELYAQLQDPLEVKVFKPESTQNYKTP